MYILLLFSLFLRGRKAPFYYFCLFIFEAESHSVAQAGVQWSARSQLTKTSTSQVQAILLPQPPK